MTQQKKKAFLSAYAEMGVISHACKAAGISRRQYYRWTEHDQTFAAEVREAEIEAVEALEREARRRALKLSDTLLIFLLKASRPEKYRDHSSVDVTSGGEKLMSIEAARSLIALARSDE